MSINMLINCFFNNIPQYTRNHGKQNSNQNTPTCNSTKQITIFIRFIRPLDPSSSFAIPFIYSPLGILKGNPVGRYLPRTVPRGLLFKFTKKFLTKILSYRQSIH